GGVGARVQARRVLAADGRERQGPADAPGAVLRGGRRPPLRDDPAQPPLRPPGRPGGPDRGRARRDHERDVDRRRPAGGGPMTDDATSHGPRLAGGTQPPPASRGLCSRVMLLPLLLLAVPACTPKAADTAGPSADQAPVPVTVAAVSPMTLRRTVTVTGTLDAFKDVTLAPEVDGRVVRVALDVGATVL